MILDVFGLKCAHEFEQAPIDDYEIKVFAEDDAPMFPAVGSVMRMDTVEIFFVDGDHGAAIYNGELHLSMIVLRIHADFMRADRIYSNGAQASRYFVREVFIQV